MSFKIKKRRPEKQGMTFEQYLRLGGVLIIVALLAIGGLGLGQTNTAALLTVTAPAGATPGALTPTPLTFPTVPPNGNLIVAERSYYHASGVLSVPKIQGFDLAPGSEELIDPAIAGGQLSRVGMTFINSGILAVAHAFVEKNGELPVTGLGDLEKYYDQPSLQAAWSNFTGGFTVVDRTTRDNRYVINFRLGLDGVTYLGRQVTAVQNGWLKTTRFVAPENNPALIDSLERTIWTKFEFNEALLTQGLSLISSVDPVSGFMIRHPATWQKNDVTLGRPFLITGMVTNAPLTLTAQSEPGKSAKTDAEARAWLSARRPQATVYNVVSETRGDATGFTLSYNDPDPDGNSRSAIVTLLNGKNGALYSATYLLNVRNQDLLAATAPAEITQSRGTFMVLDTTQLVPTLTPSPTWTPIPTVTPLVTPTP